MSVETRLVAALLVATAAAYLLTPVAIRAANHLDFFDQPKGYKGHATPIPYLGGSAVLAAFLLALLALAGDAARTVPLLAATAVLWAVGTVDDRRHLSPALRVAVEVTLALGLWGAGLGWELGHGDALDAALTVIWVVGVVNAFNLFDNMDGATSTMGAVVGGAVAILGVVDQDPWLTAGGAALAGACLGFIPYNLARPHARIFLGDGGSMPVGLVAATLVMTGASAAASGLEAVALGLLLVGVPATDTALVIISRRRKGISVLTGGRDHLTHRVRRRVGTARAVAVTLGAVQALVAVVALVALGAGPATIIGVAVVVLAAGGTAIALMEREEDRLVMAGDVVVPQEALDQARERRGASWSLGDVALVVFALGAALSPLAFGYYGTATWVPIGLALTVIAAMGAIRRPPHLTLSARLVVGGLAAIGLLALLSSGWATSADLAGVDANRWIVLAVVAGLAVLLVRSPRRELLAVGVLSAGITVVAVVVLVKMLGSSAPELFLTGRLHQPLGYVNAEATVFLMGAWLLFFAAERPQLWLAGPALGIASLLASLALLSQSRGAALAAAAGVVAMVAFIPGRTRRATALLCLAAGMAVAARPLLDVLTSIDSPAGLPTAEAVHAAARGALVGGIVTGALWTAATVVRSQLSASAQQLARRAIQISFGIAAVAAISLAVTSAGRISREADAQWAAFTSVSRAEPAAVQAPPADGSRLFSGAGNRYDYWRVAWDAFERNPVAGIGAGNFTSVWLRERRVGEDVRQPHSIQLQVLSELGVLGGVALLAVLAGLLGGILATGRHVRAGLVAPGVAAGATGAAVTWLAHTSVDWQHLLPGVTAIALLSAAVLVRRRPLPSGAAGTANEPGTADATPPRPRRAVEVAAFGATAIVIAIAGATLTRQAVADHARAQAYELLRADPQAAIVQADRSLRLNDASLRSLYVKAAAQARLDQAAAAEATLRRATQTDPSNPVPWALLGDLATRRGNDAQAKAFYRRAAALSPLDSGLQRQAGAG